MAAVIEDVALGSEDPVGEPIAAPVLPDILDRIEFGAFGRQRQEGDVGRHNKLVRAMPSGLPAWSRISTACAPGVTALAISAKCRIIAALLQRGRTRAAPVPRGGQIAPKMEAEAVR
jgi:hypothetical protein